MQVKSGIKLSKLPYWNADHATLSTHYIVWPIICIVVNHGMHVTLIRAGLGLTLVPNNRNAIWDSGVDREIVYVNTLNRAIHHWTD